jgi:poly(rC)-binding protein 3/4
MSWMLELIDLTLSICLVLKQYNPESVVQNFMAEAAAPAQQQTGGPPADQGYNSYPAHSSVYASPPSNPGHAGAYGAVYGANYGYQ